MMEGDLALPIDIHYSKLTDWLIDRRHCDGKWSTKTRAVRERVQSNLSHLPQELLSRVQGDTASLNYFQCQHIFEELKKVYGNGKSLFGKFLSTRVQSLARCQQTQLESLKREEEFRSSVASLKSKFLSSCEEMGIKGERVRDELQDLLSELPQIFQQTLSLLPSLSPAVQLYKSVIQHNTGRAIESDQFLPMLHYILQNGNVTVYQWKHGTKPEQSEEKETLEERGGCDEETGIDWGDLAETETETVEAIVWEDVATEQLSLIEVVGESARPNEGGVATEQLSLIEVVGESARLNEGGVATDQCEVESDRDTLLLSSPTRGLFLDNLLELQEFLTWRLRELSTTHNLLSAQFGSEGAEQEVGPERLQTMLDAVSSVLETLTSPRTQHLLLMRNSAHYLDRLTGSLLSPQRLASKAQAQAELAAGRREEAVAMAIALQPQLTALINDSRTLQRQLEQQISQLYQSREVNIMGEINITLQPLT